MARGNGSYMGQTVNPNSNVASGIWTVREAETYLRADKWPAQPTVPSAPSGTAGDGEVELTWTAPTGGSTPTDYIIQHSSDGGASWTTFSDGVSTATTATVTGLTNGTGYIFRIIAVNALGQGPAGSASGTITPAALDVSLLLHFDGADGSSVITDSSPNNWSLTASGGAQISTAQSRFGGSSLAVGPDSAVTGTGTEPIVDFDGGPGTVEGWVYITTGVPSGYFGGFVGPQGASGMAGLLLGMVAATKVGGSYLAAGTATSSVDFTLNEWHHLAYVLEADGVTLNIYVDGALAVTATASGSHNLTGIVIGNALVGSQINFSGYIDEIRVTRSAVYPGPFTPPTAPF